MHRKASWLLLILWAIGLLCALLVYGQRQLSEFDPNGELLHRTTAPDFDATLVAILEKQDIQPGSIIHVGTQSRCYCDTLTKPHQSQLLAKIGDDYHQVRLNVEDIPELAAMLEALPALIVLDKHKQLRYLGPYATGYGCFTGKNLVEQVVNYTTQLPYAGAVINTDATGCFC
ncbi:thioredoxin [Alteromonas sp. Mex14]|nr:thioredoxin [Alteromonas sp. Mex14]